MLSILIKSELAYYKTALLCLYLFIVVFILLNLFVGDLLDVILRALIFTLPVLGLVMRLDERGGKKRRLLLSLPVPLWKVAVVRQIIWTGYWTSAFALVAASLLLESVHLDHYWLMLVVMNGALVFILTAAVLDNLFTFRGSRKKSVAVTFLLVAASVTCYLLLTFSQPVIRLLRHGLVNGAGVFTLCILALLLLVLDIFTFAHRRSFI